MTLSEGHAAPSECQGGTYKATLRPALLSLKRESWSRPPVVGFLGSQKLSYAGLALKICSYLCCNFVYNKDLLQGSL